MHRIDGPGHLLNQWTQGNPVTGVEPTEVTADFMEAVQEEIAAVIENTGAALNKADNTQLLQAVSAGLINPWANRLLNTQFEFWQRHGDDAWDPAFVTVLAASGQELFGPDRWILRPGDASADADYMRKEFALGTIPIGMESQGQPRYYMQIDQQIGSTGVQPSIRQRIEGVRTFAGLKVSVSFVARVTSGTVNAWAIVNQHYGTGGSPSTNNEQMSAGFTLTTTWTRFTATFTLDPMTGKTIGTNPNDFLEVGVEFPVAQTKIIQITDIRITPGSTTNNTLLLPSYIDFMGCLRYYEKGYAEGGTPGTNHFPGAVYGTLNVVDNVAKIVSGAAVRFAVPKRIGMGRGVDTLTRASGQWEGLQRIWRAGATPTIGELDLNNTATILNNFTPSVDHRDDEANQLQAITITDPNMTGTFEFFFQWDADAEIYLAL